jgi:hypothetical protein
VRLRPCGFYAPAKNWATDSNHDGGWYRCPLCGLQYTPWQVRPTAYINANRLYVLEAEEDHTTVSGERILGGSVSFLPAYWPDTSTTALEGRLKEIYMGLNEEISAKTPQEVKQWVMDKTDAMAQRKTYFKRMKMTGVAKQTIDEQNKVARPDRQFSYKHLEEDFLGARYIMKEGEPVLGQDDLIRVWAYTRRMVHNAMGRP